MTVQGSSEFISGENLINEDRPNLSETTSTPSNFLNFKKKKILLTPIPLVLGLFVILFALNQKFNIFTHAGISLFNNCTPIPTGMTASQIEILSKSGKVRWCNFTSNLNPIALENLKTGSTKWRITEKNIDPDYSDDEAPTHKSFSTSNILGSQTTSGYIEGYSAKQSYQAGDNAIFYVHSSDSSFKADIYRLGWYGGTGSRYMITYQSSITNTNAPTITPDPTTGLLSENWQPSFNFTIPSDWTTGLYMIKLTGSISGSQAYIPFVLKDPNSNSDLIFIHADNTDQAYNHYGGVSLYWNYNNSLPTGHGDYVSFNRPYFQNAGMGASMSWEYPMIRWLESKGYNITYVSDSDIEANPSLLLNHKGIITAGHTEYWSKNMYDGLDNAISHGVSFTNFSANEIYWHIRYSDSTNRTIISYKDPQTGGTYVDPLYSIDPTQDTSMWRTGATSNRPEQSTAGSMYSSYFSPSDTTFPWVASNTSNWPAWLISNTNIQDGTTINGIVGYEYDKLWTNYSSPSGDIIISNSPVSNVYANPTGTINDYSNSTLYKSTSGAWVFNAGSIDWSWGLDDWTASFADYPNRPAVANSSIQQMTANLLNQIIGYIPPTPTLMPSNTPTPTITPTPIPYYNQTINDGASGYFRLSDNTDTATNIKVSPQGTYINSPTKNQPGALKNDPNTSILFNGTNQYVSIPYNTTLTNYSSFSIEAWAYVNGGAGTYRGIVADRKYPDGWVMYANSSNRWSFWINNGTQMSVLNGPSISNNLWAYLVGTYDSSTKTATFYVNGQKVASTSISTYTRNPQTPETIANGEYGSSYYFPGKIDEVAFYNKALNATQILNHYKAAGY